MEFIALVIAIIAFIFSRKALKQLQAMEARLARWKPPAKARRPSHPRLSRPPEQPRPLAEAGETETPATTGRHRVRTGQRHGFRGVGVTGTTSVTAGSHPSGLR